MSFASDLQSVASADDVQMINGRTRVQAIYYVNTSSAGYIRLYDGTDGSTDPKIDLATPAAAGSVSIELPNAGVLFKNGVYMESSEVVDTTLFFYGGSKVDVDIGITVTGVSGSATIRSVSSNAAANTEGSGSDGTGEIGDVTVDTVENP